LGKLRLRLVVAVGALALAVFAGACGGDDDDDDSGGEEASATDVTVADAR
jgi:hypothetical protein